MQLQCERNIFNMPLLAAFVSIPIGSDDDEDEDDEVTDLNAGIASRNSAQHRIGVNRSPLLPPDGDEPEDGEEAR
jgi:hypothetical protein